MKFGFYPRLAFDGIRKNKRMYIPYLLTCIGMVAMYYIMLFLEYSDAVSSLTGGETIREMLGFGGWVIAIFSCIFLFYTNSFLMRRRKKEFGLYNILGMGKWNIGRILFWETLLLALISLTAGLFCGITLSKLAELGLVNVMQGGISYTFFFSPYAILMSVLVFGAIFLLLFFNSIRQIHFSSAISLFRSENVGEKPPKGNWFLGILGVLILAAAYTLAIIIKDPVTALGIFFIAVIMVILGTYLILISGSVLLCRILQKKKNYYYKTNHFVSVASMAYRMKRNGAGLASVCILATMILVIVSSTTSLYFGAEDSLLSRYPREFYTRVHFRGMDTFSDEAIRDMESRLNKICADNGVTPKNVVNYRFILHNGYYSDGVASFENRPVDFTASDARMFCFLPLDDYNATMGTNVTLKDDEALVGVNRGEWTESEVTLGSAGRYKVKGEVGDLPLGGEFMSNIVTTVTVVLPKLPEFFYDNNDPDHPNEIDSLTAPNWIYCFDTGLDEEGQIALRGSLREVLFRFNGANGFTLESRAASRADFYGLYGGLFYLGIILSIVFIFAAVLIIYYKQISEGYEDQGRFEIMQKVGMTGREIRKSINSQLLTVFFLPLVFAACHLAFAFPIIRKLLLLFNLNNVMLFALTTIISVVIFALFYTLVYRVTSNAYYNIVSGVKNNEQ